MRKPSKNFADPKWLKATLVVAFQAWAQMWVKHHEINDAAVAAVRQVLAAALAKEVGHDPTVAEALEQPLQFYLENSGYDGHGDVILLEKFLEDNGCWLPGRLEHCSDWLMRSPWLNQPRIKERFSPNARGNIIIVARTMKEQLRRDPTVADIRDIKLWQLLAMSGVGLQTAKVVDAFRRDCGFEPMQPLK